MPQGKPRSVREALSPRSPVRKRPKARITLAPCPICRRSMSLVVLNTHVDRCKPPRSRAPPSPKTPPTQPTQQSSLSQSYIGPPPDPALAKLPDIHFLLRRDAAFNPICTVQSTPCETCRDEAPLAFSAVVALRGYHASTPPRAQVRTQLFLHACPSPSSTAAERIPSLPAGCPAARLPLSILKSALQKCVRRRLSQPAVRVAVALLRKTGSPFELLRRLSIIVLEDAALHPAFPTLVWLLAASSKGYAASFEDVRTIVGVVHELAALRVRDGGIYQDGGESGSKRANQQATGTSGPGLAEDYGGAKGEGSERWRSVVESIRIRACYGGMPFDQSLLHRAVAVWEARFSADAAAWEGLLSRAYDDAGTDKITEDGLRALFREDEAVLRPGDIPPAAWDFHCCSVADEVSREMLGRGGPVVGRFPRGFDDVKNGIQGLMWTYRSGVNVKKAWKTLDEAVAAQKGDDDGKPEESASADEVLWRTEIEPSVHAWCRRYRRRYGL